MSSRPSCGARLARLDPSTRSSCSSARFRVGRSWRSFRACIAATRSRPITPPPTTWSACSISSRSASGRYWWPPACRVDPIPASTRSSPFGSWPLASCRLARTVARRACKRAPAYEQNTLIVGAGEVGQLIARKLVKHPEYGVNVVGFIDRDPKARRPDLPEHLAILGGPERLPEIVKCLDVERVVIAFSNEPVEELLSLLRQLRAFPVQIDLVPRLFELVGPRLTVHAVEGLPLLGLPPNHASRTSRMLKRLVDIVGAAGRANRPVAGVRLHRAPYPARLGRAGVLPPDPPRHEHERVHRSSSSAR